MEPSARPEDFGVGRLFEHVKDAVIVADPKSERILLWNAGATEIFGYGPEEALTMPLHQLVAPHLVERHREGLARYEAEGTSDLVDSGKALEVEGLRKDGSIVVVELTLTSISQHTSTEGTVVMALIRDATDRKAAEKLRAAQLSRQQALELHDSVLQDLVVSKAYFELGDADAGLAALDKALQTARSMVDHMLQERESLFGLRPGDFVRSLSEETEESP